MRSLVVGTVAAVLLAFTWNAFLPHTVEGASETAPAIVDVLHPEPSATTTTTKSNRTPAEAVKTGIEWLVSVQGNDGGWGQDGGETSYVRQGENLETSSNDVANTAVATLALIRSGHTPTEGKHRNHTLSGIEFILRSVEASPEAGLAVTKVTGSQIQRKLGPYIDTFLTSRLLTEIEGEMGSGKMNQRVHAALEKCLRKIESHQQEDGSWNISGGWAPILGTSLASQSLAVAQKRGFEVDKDVLAKADEYSENIAMQSAGGVSTGVAGGVAYSSRPVDAGSAGVDLYRDAQVLEQLSRNAGKRRENAKAIRSIEAKLSDSSFQAGFGSMGGEEFFSYLNISDSLHRSGGEQWKKWNGDIKTKLARLQNSDGSWAGHHCITGRVAVTGAAVLTLQVDKQTVEEL